MKQQGATARTFIVIAILMIGLVIFFGLLFYRHVSNESDYLTERNLRELNRLDSVLKLRIENYTNKVLINLVTIAANDYRENKSDGCRNKPAEAERFACYFKSTAQVAPNLSLVPGIKIETISSQQTVYPLIALDPKQEGGAFNIYIDYRGPLGLVAGRVVSLRVALKMEDLTRGRWGNVFDDVVIARLDGRENRVLFQRESSGLLRLDQIPLPKDEKNKADAGKQNDNANTEPGKEEKATTLRASLLTASGVFPVELAGTSYQLFIQPMQLSLLPTSRFSLNGSKESDTDWVLCGLVRSSRFRDQSWSLSNPLLILFLFVFAIVTTGAPLLKLWSLGPQDELSLSDAIFASFSVLIVSSLLTFLVMGVYACQQQRRQLDQQLTKFASTMADNFSHEIELICQMLDRMNQQLKDQPGLEDSKPQVNSILCIGEQCPLSWLSPDGPYFQMTSVVKPDGMQFGKWSRDKVTTPLIPVDQRPYFRKIVEEQGWDLPNRWKPSQQDKFGFYLEPILSWNTGEPQAELSIPGPRNDDGSLRWVATATPDLISVQNAVVPPGFGYAILDHRGKVGFHSDSTLVGSNFFEECGNDLELQALVFAKATRTINVQCAGQDRRAIVHPLAGVPWTLVVFKDWANLQTANLELLSSALIIGIFYGLVFVVPVLWLCLRKPKYLWLDCARWLEYRLLFAANLVLIALLLLTECFLVPHYHVPAAAFVVPPFALLLSYLKLKEAEGLRWRRNPLLVTLLLLPALLMFMNWWNREIMTTALDRRALIGGFLQAVVLYAVFFLTFYRQRLPSWWVTLLKGDPSAEAGCRTMYLLVGTTLVVITSVLPAMSFFRSAQDAEMEILVKHAQFRFAHALEQREQRVRKEFEKALQPPARATQQLRSDTDQFILERLKTTRDDIYVSTYFYDTEIPDAMKSKGDTKKDSPPDAHVFDTIMEKIRPLYNEAGIEIQELVRNETADKSFRWTPSGSRIELVTMPDSSGRPLRVSSSIPSLGWPDSLWEWIVVIAVVPLFFVLIIYFLLRSVARRVLLLGMDVPRVGSLNVESLGSVSENTLLLGTPHSGKSHLLERPDFHRIDLRQFAAAGDWQRALRQEIPQDIKVVALDHLEFGMDDPGYNGWKLLLLERFLHSGHRLVVASSADPLSFAVTMPKSANAIEGPLQKESGNENEGKATRKTNQGVSADTDRWASLWASFNRRVYTVKGAVPGHAEALAYYRELWATCSRGEKIALLDLAQDGLVNRNNPGFPRLIERGLAMCPVYPQLTNQGLRRFAVETGVRKEVETLRKQEWSHWNVIQGILLALIIGAALFVYLALPQALSYSTTFIGAVAAGIPTLMKLFDLFRGKFSSS